MKIALVGAFDRNNYGDILMPIILEMRLNQVLNDISFEYFGLMERDMTAIGGCKTVALSKLYSSCEKYDCVIVVGGEVLASRYTNMYLNLMNNGLVITYYKILRKLSPTLVERICKRKLNGQDRYPWIIDKAKINCDKLIYNSVGGKDIDLSEEIKCLVNKFDYVSVRDKETYNVLKNINNDVQLYPDSVISLSKFINDEFLNDRVADNLKKKLGELDKYFVIQVKKKIGDKIYNELLEQIEYIYNNYNIPCVLLPIGYAQGHEDHIILRKLKKHLKSKAILIENNTVYDTAYVIKNSVCYVGTSLHGAITAISYNVPHIALTNQIPKLLDFLQTWDTTPIIYTLPSELGKNLEKLLHNETVYEKVKMARDRLLQKSDENFEKIYEVIVMKNE